MTHVVHQQGRGQFGPVSFWVAMALLMSANVSHASRGASPPPASQRVQTVTSSTQANGSSGNKTWWQQNCLDETNIPSGDVARACINFGVVNGFQGLRDYLAYLITDIRSATNVMPFQIQALYRDDALNAQSAFYLQRGLDMLSPDTGFPGMPPDSPDKPHSLRGIGAKTDVDAEASVGSMNPYATQAQAVSGGTVPVASASSRGMGLRIMEQLAQAAWQYTGLDVSRQATAKSYIAKVLPNYCPRDLTAHVPQGATSPVGLSVCLQQSGTTSTFSQPFGNFDIMASSLLGPSDYSDAYLANSYAWLNHSNWADPKKAWNADLASANRFQVWFANPTQFNDAAKAYIQMIVGPSYSGLSSKVFSDPSSGTWQINDTEAAQTYFLAVRQIAALKSLVLNSFYSMYYDRVHDDPTAAASDGELKKAGSVLSIMEEEVSKRFGNTSEVFCMPVVSDGSQTPGKGISDPGCPATNDPRGTLASGQIYSRVNWHNYIDSLPPELVLKELTHMMAADMALRLKAYKQAERMEALMAGQLAVLTQQMEMGNRAIAGVDQPSAAQIKNQFNQSQSSSLPSGGSN